MKASDLKAMVESGVHPVVTFKKEPWDDAYLEAGMRARCAAAVDDTDGMVRVEFDFNEFTEHNRQCEQPLYYDDKQNPCLTATAANMVPKDNRERIYFMPEDVLDEILTIGDDFRARLYQRYRQGLKAGTVKGTYVEWLEDTVMDCAAMPVILDGGGLLNQVAQ